MNNQRKQAQNKPKQTMRVMTFELEKDLIPCLKKRAKRFERSMSGHLRVLVKEDLNVQAT